MSTLSCRSAQLTYRGRRPSNQDAVMSLRLPGDRELFAVADGTGGHASGEIASATALEVLARELRAGATLLEAVRLANSVIHTRAHGARHAREGMATTLVALLRTGASYQIANVGDSRAYRVQRASIQQLTLDHSFIAEAVRMGGMSAEAAARSPWRNMVTRALGMQGEIEVDLFGPFEAGRHPHAILLCTDGLHKVLADESIHQCLLSAEDPRAAAEMLSSFAFLAGSTDNITAVVVEFGSLFRSSEVPTLPFGQLPHTVAPVA